LYAKPIVKAYQDYLHSRVYVYGKRHHRKISLMDIATICAKELRKSGKLSSLDLSDENNACSINVNVKIDNKIVKYLLMFKNETHNHPTEIEPFGGAATCLGGAIRDPLSGRTYVYQAMRVTGSGDPTVSLNETLPNKLSQRTITLGAAKGYSSYGNQIGLATGQVDEVYHPGYVAKRMEIGAVIGAAPKNNVVRKTPQSSDVIILLGGRTGKDGIGGATGSSKAHTIKSINEASAEVQKGNPICERKIQRLFRNPAATQLIKKCNDFGAGGVSVAIGELCRGVEINLNAVPKKYLGLNGTEIAISESQERMAVIVSKQDKNEFIALAQKENLEATVVAKVTNTNRLQMY
jgi:phosphoribosylformylglycinamidine synthase